MRPAQASLLTPLSVGCELLPFWHAPPRRILCEKSHEISFFGHPLDHGRGGRRCRILTPSRQDRSCGSRRPPLFDSSLYAQKCPRDSHQQEQDTHEDAQHSHEEDTVQTCIRNHAFTMPMEWALKSVKPRMHRMDPLLGRNSMSPSRWVLPAPQSADLLARETARILPNAA